MKTIYQTEQSGQHQFGAVGDGLIAAKGLATDGHKPLMRNRSAAIEGGLRDGITAPNTLSPANKRRDGSDTCTNRVRFVFISHGSDSRAVFSPGRAQ